MSTPTTIRMPQLGETVTEGTITRWLKQVGDAIEKYEAFAEVATDKVNAEIPAPVAGVLLSILVHEGETVPTGEPIATIGLAASETIAEVIAPAEPSIPKSAPVTAMPTVSPVNAPQLPVHDAAVRPAVRYSPAVRRAARERGVDPATLGGSGAQGRVTLRDIESTHATPAPTSKTTPPFTAGENVTRIPLTRARRMIAEHMVKAKQTIPHAWTMIEVDVSALVARRHHDAAGFAAQHGFKPTYFHYFSHAVVRTLAQHPMLNARYTSDAIEVFRDIDLAFAIALDGNLVVPVIARAQAMEFPAFAAALADVTKRARGNHLSIDELTGGTITVNNTGANGSILSAPIINGGQAAIITMESIVKRPVVVAHDAIAIRSMMNVCISIDHRVVDGDVVGGFLRDLKLRLQDGG